MAKVDDVIAQLQALSAEERQQVLRSCPSVVKTESAARGVEPATMVTSHTLHAKLPTFSGAGGKGDVSYEQWRSEVEGMQNGIIYPEQVVLQTVRRSLRGTAADVLLHMGQSVEVKDVLEKMDSMFGIILPPESILESFFSAKQTETETIANWACRLESILEQFRRQKQNTDTDEEGAEDAVLEDEETMLRRKFFSGLHSGPVKAALRHKLDTGKSYKELLVAARTVELEQQKRRRQSLTKQQPPPLVQMQSLTRFWHQYLLWRSVCSRWSRGIGPQQRHRC